MTTRRAVIVGCLLALAGAGMAEAHARLVLSAPAEGAVLPLAPGRLVLSFSEVPRLVGSGVKLTGPGGRAMLLTPLKADARDPRVISAPMPNNAGPGAYRVEWRALAGGGHRTQGTFSFTVKGR